ncbi:anticodon nuclease [Acinetobacter nosocomialis]|jgi:wobble nucleotide-excising tRNase|uniref:anticodon nuclease n=1 Tax=Acinetobacter nosocomialis TaxID=106654 RepID=UPI0025A088F3|nr:anticodon nuclease [Acinetobacter nosocomialis]MDQ8874881.1 anticodon nuclease [Acinetobacter nosocomialis]
MSKTLTEIAQLLKDSPKKVQLIYAFNGTGKTRLSREFKNLIAPKNQEDNGNNLPRQKILYYNAFTEDLFYWDNDLQGDTEPKLKIQPNTYTDWLLTLLKDLGQDRNIVKYFQNYTSDKLTPNFSADLTEVTFSFERGDDENFGNLKISKGEESNFIWSVFYTLLDQVVTILNVAEIADRETDKFDQLEYIFIDDPVSSLDENHLIELAVHLAELIRSAPLRLKFIITTHNPLFYNVLYSELGVKSGYILSKFDEDFYDLEEKKGSSNKAFSYHLHIKQIIEQAIKQNHVQRYHFTLLRNLYEKIAGFFGYKEWADLLNTVEGNKQSYITLMNSLSHLKLSNAEIAELTPPQKQTVRLLLDNLINNYGAWPEEEDNDARTN